MYVQGRKSVRYGDFQFCEQAKSVIVVSITFLKPVTCINCSLGGKSMTVCFSAIEEHQSSVEASPGGGDALICGCSSVFRS